MPYPNLKSWESAFRLIFSDPFRTVFTWRSLVLWYLPFPMCMFLSTVMAPEVRLPPPCRPQNVGAAFCSSHAVRYRCHAAPLRPQCHRVPGQQHCRVSHAALRMPQCGTWIYEPFGNMGGRLGVIKYKRIISHGRLLMESIEHPFKILFLVCWCYLCLIFMIW